MGRNLEPHPLRKEVREWGGCAQSYTAGKEEARGESVPIWPAQGRGVCIFCNPRGQSFSAKEENPEADSLNSSVMEKMGLLSSELPTSGSMQAKVNMFPKQICVGYLLLHNKVPQNVVA